MMEDLIRTIGLEFRTRVVVSYKQADRSLTVADIYV